MGPLPVTPPAHNWGERRAPDKPRGALPLQKGLPSGGSHFGIKEQFCGSLLSQARSFWASPGCGTPFFIAEPYSLAWMYPVCGSIQLPMDTHCEATLHRASVGTHVCTLSSLPPAPPGTSRVRGVP